EALGVVADGATMVSELAGVDVQQAGAEKPDDSAEPAKAAPAGGGDGDTSTFLGALKAGIHASLLELGTASLIAHGKQLGNERGEQGKEGGRAAVKKGSAAAKAVGAKVKGVLLGSVIPFQFGGGQHELWAEERPGGIGVFFASNDPHNVAAN